jgi:hypothetical protein
MINIAGQYVVAPAFRRTDGEMLLSGILLFMIVLSIVFQNPFDSADPVAKNDLQFRRLNLVQKCDNALKKVLWVFERLADERSLEMPKKPEVRRCQIWTVGRVRDMQKVILYEKLFGCL